MWDRTELLDCLESVTERNGNFVCLLGGKSTGKSLVLEEFAETKIHRKKNLDRNVVHIDMRSAYPSITTGFVIAIKDSKEEKWRDILLAFGRTMFASKLEHLDGQVDRDFLNLDLILYLIRREPDQIFVLGELLNQMTSRFPSTVFTLVIDEANLPLTINEKTSAADIKEVKGLLALFTKLTKQEKKVNNNGL